MKQSTETGVVEVFTCECRTGFNWKTKATYRTHFKSQRHKAHEITAQELEHRKSVTRLQIEADKLKSENVKLMEMYMQLMYKYEDLRKQTQSGSTIEFHPIYS